MLKTVILARKLLLSCIVVALGIMFTPALTAQAQGVTEPATPPAPEHMRGFRLERTWARQQRIQDHLSFMFDHAQPRIDQAQQLIDRAKAEGKDTSALQAALDALAQSVKDARPVFESTKGVIASHHGFDVNGKVTDLDLAADTVEEMGAKLKEIRGMLFDPAKALRDAIRAFREVNGPN
jgi:uncharacterized protein YoxC